MQPHVHKENMWLVKGFASEVKLSFNSFSDDPYSKHEGNYKHASVEVLCLSSWGTLSSVDMLFWPSCYENQKYGRYTFKMKGAFALSRRLVFILTLKPLSTYQHYVPIIISVLTT